MSGIRRSSDGPQACSAADSVDRLLGDWARERPDLDFAPVGIVTRLARVRSHLETELERVFDRYDLSPADFVVIVSLRRAGAPYRLPQAGLMSRLALTSGTVSVRVDRLVKRGVVVREPSPGDRRGQLVRLTDKGLRLFDEIAPVHLANEERLLSALTPDERSTLTDLLRRLLLSFEPGNPGAVRSLGLQLEPAHVARRRRAAVGLSDPPGLLVADHPPEGSPAAAAGLTRGDLITAIDGRPVLSDTALSDAISAGAGARLAVTVLRGEQRHQLILAVPSGTGG